MSFEMLMRTAIVACFAGATTLAMAADVDCAGCHDVPPVPDGHMEVEEVSVDGCTMCHESAGDDAFFRAVHEKHGDALGCDTCHEDAGADRDARLKEMLGQ
jgi:hypothetical protein